MLGLYPLHIFSEVSTAHLAHSRNTLVANVLGNYLYLFSRDQRREGGFLRLTWGKVLNEKKQPSKWPLIPSFRSGYTWVPCVTCWEKHRQTLEFITKSLVLELITFVYHPGKPAISWDWGATKEYGIRCQNTFWRTLFSPISVMGKESEGLTKKSIEISIEMP